MDTSLTTTSSEAIDRFLAKEEQLQNGNRSTFLSPARIKFNGTTGKFTKKYWDQGQQKMVEEPFLQTWTGTILNPTMHLYAWAYEEGNHVEIKTREFEDFNGPIELLKIDHGEKDKNKKTTSLGHFQNLTEFKAKFGQTDIATGKTKYPWDLNEVIYIYVHEMNQVVKYVFSSSLTRDEWWDYKKPSVYKVVGGIFDDSIRSFAQVKTEFGGKQVESDKKNADGTPKIFYAGTFRTHSMNSMEELEKIMEMSEQLDAWRASFLPNKGIVVPQTALTESDIVQALPRPSEKEINVADLPF